MVGCVCVNGSITYSMFHSDGGTAEFIVIANALLIVIAVAWCILIGVVATRLWAKVVGILLGVVSIIPIAGPVVFLVVNEVITRTLRRHGVKVGFLGADPSTI